VFRIFILPKQKKPHHSRRLLLVRPAEMIFFCNANFFGGNLFVITKKRFFAKRRFVLIKQIKLVRFRLLQKKQVMGRGVSSLQYQGWWVKLALFFVVLF